MTFIDSGRSATDWQMIVLPLSFKKSIFNTSNINNDCLHCPQYHIVQRFNNRIPFSGLSPLRLAALEVASEK